MIDKSFISSLFSFKSSVAGSMTAIYISAKFVWVYRPGDEDNERISRYYQIENDGWEKIFAAIKTDIGPSVFQVVLGVGRYHFLTVDRPNVDAEEINQALLWTVKDLVALEPHDIHLDYFELPLADKNRINVIASQRSFLTEILLAMQKSGSQAVGISVEELMLTNLYPDDPTTRLVISHIPEQELLLTVIRDGDLYMQRRVRGFTHLHQADEQELRYELADKLSLEIQRSMDYFDSQLRLSPVATIKILVQGEFDILARLVAANFNLPVTALPNTTVGAKIAELGYLEFERGAV